MMKELQNIQFFYLKKAVRTKKFAHRLRFYIKKREEFNETIEQKQARIKANANKINERL